MKRLIYLPKPDEQTIKRIQEIKFYLITESLLKYHQIHDVKTTAVLETLADLTNVSKTLIVISSLEIHNHHFKPTKPEIAVALAYLMVPVRKIQELTGITGKTYYTYLNDFIRYGAQLKPQFQDERHTQINKFIINLKSLLNLAMGVLIYDKY